MLNQSVSEWAPWTLVFLAIAGTYLWRGVGTAIAARIDPEAGVWCQMPRDGAGRMKGFATVKFPDSTYATRALEAMNGAELKGRELLVKYDFRAGPVHASAAVQPRPCSHAAILRPVQPTPCRPPRALREPHALVRPAPPSTAPRAAD